MKHKKEALILETDGPNWPPLPGTQGLGSSPLPWVWLDLYLACNKQDMTEAMRHPFGGQRQWIPFLLLSLVFSYVTHSGKPPPYWEAVPWEGPATRGWKQVLLWSPEMTVALAITLMDTFRETLSQNDPAELLPDSCATETVRINTCCFQPLNCGVIC